MVNIQMGTTEFQSSRTKREAGGWGWDAEDAGWKGVTMWSQVPWKVGKRGIAEFREPLLHWLWIISTWGPLGPFLLCILPARIVRTFLVHISVYWFLTLTVTCSLLKVLLLSATTYLSPLVNIYWGFLFVCFFTVTFSKLLHFLYKSPLLYIQHAAL